MRLKFIAFAVLYLIFYFEIVRVVLDLDTLATFGTGHVIKLYFVISKEPLSHILQATLVGHLLRSLVRSAGDQDEL
jgi:hypothetical protein